MTGQGPSSPASRRRGDGVAQALARVEALLAGGPKVDAPVAYGAPSRLARNLSLRLDRHTRLHNRDVADALRAAIGVVVDEVAARSSVSDARTTALEVQVARLAGQAMAATGAAGGVDAESATEAWRRRLEEEWAPRVPRPVVEPAVRLETRVGSLTSAPMSAS